MSEHVIDVVARQPKPEAAWDVVRDGLLRVGDVVAVGEPSVASMSVTVEAETEQDARGVIVGALARMPTSTDGAFFCRFRRS